MKHMDQAITVSIVEDSDQIRRNLALLINETPGFQCSATYASAEQALEQLPSCPPDVVLMDIHLPGLSGVDCVRRLKQSTPGLQVVMLTVYEDSDLVFQALQAGANGYLLKRATPEQILEAIREVHGGGAPMSSHIARLVVQSFERHESSHPDTENLTPREEEILNYVAKGFINKEIADALCIGTETVRSHLKSIYDKLHVRSRTEAVMKFYRR